MGVNLYWKTCSKCGCEIVYDEYSYYDAKKEGDFVCYTCKLLENEDDVKKESNDDT